MVIKGGVHVYNLLSNKRAVTSNMQAYHCDHFRFSSCISLPGSEGPGGGHGVPVPHAPQEDDLPPLPRLVLPG